MSKKVIIPFIVIAVIVAGISLHYIGKTYYDLEHLLTNNTPGTTKSPGQARSPKNTKKSNGTPTPAIEATPNPTEAALPNVTEVPPIINIDFNFAYSLSTRSQHGATNNEQKLLIEKYGGYYKKDQGYKRIYLAYNLGTEYGHTHALLDKLKEKNIKATFFVLGSYVKEQNRSILERIIEEGHVLGSHGYSHANQTNPNEWTVEKLVQDFENMDNRIKDVLGDDVKIFYYRPPYGYYNERMLYIARQRGMTPVFWTFTYADWGTVDTEDINSIYELYMKNLQDGMITQLHVANTDNIRVLDLFADKAREMGYEFYTLDERR